MILQQIISQSSIPDLTGIVVPTTVLDISQVTNVTIYWFIPYKAADYPELTFSKTYFFVYSTDHDGLGIGSGDGGIYVGEGDNLDLSDFTELGLIIDGYQAETPWLWYFSANTRKIHLYYHTAGEPGSSSGSSAYQETRCISTNTGSLYNSTWTDEGYPLGYEVGDEHTGYLKFWDINGVLKGTHYKVGIGAVSYVDGQQQISEMASDGLSCTRGALVPLYTPNLAPNRMINLSNGRFFEKYGQWWWIGCTRPTYNYGLTLTNTPESQYVNLILCKANTDLELTELVATLYTGGRYWESYIVDDTMHLYHARRTLDVQYTTFDLTQLTYFI